MACRPDRAACPLLRAGVAVSTHRAPPGLHLLPCHRPGEVVWAVQVVSSQEQGETYPVAPFKMQNFSKGCKNFGICSPAYKSSP